MNNNIVIVVDGWWGSCGKGNVCSSLAKHQQFDLFSGQNGPNAGHTTVVDDQKMVWKVLPSACASNPATPVVLGPATIFDPGRLHEEAARISAPIFLHRGATALTPQDKAWEEQSTTLLHIASTCQGTAGALIRKITRGKNAHALDIMDLPGNVRLIDSIEMSKLWSGARVLHEVAQGALLSIDHGTYPWTTSRNCTAQQAVADMLFPRDYTTLAVYRTFPIRVGNHQGFSGDMPNETTWADIAARPDCPYSVDELESRERTTVTNRLRRVALPSADVLRRSLSIVSPDAVGLTFCDYGGKDDLRAMLEAEGREVSFHSTGPRTEDVVWCD